MTDLTVLSMTRASVPRFAGSSYPEQLDAGRAAALATLQKYVPNFAYDPAGADQTLREIDVWQQRNNAAVVAALQGPADAMPQAIQLAMGQAKAASYIIAVFTRAASGMGPWMSGAVAVASAQRGTVNADWARTDAEMRLQVFGGIVKMDSDGHLAQFFAPGSLGIAIPVLVAIVSVALMSVILYYMYASKRLEANNRLMRDLCERGGGDTLAQCIKATEGLQKEGPVPDWFLLGILVVGGAIAAAKFLPIEKLWRR